MKKVSTIGMDLAKNVFHIHGVDEYGKFAFRKKLSRSKVLEFFAQLPVCVVAVEACCGANYWTREIEQFGHETRMISPQYVKPYVKTNKNDYNDAEAICEAATRPNMRFVPKKSLEQQNIQALHRIRQLLIKDRTATANQARGLLLDLGIAIPQGINHVRKQLPLIFEDLTNRLDMMARDYLSDLYERLISLDEKIAASNQRLQKIAAESDICKCLKTIPGIGDIGATAIYASAGNGAEFKNGRHFSAWLGLVPKQHSTGGKSRLLGISKRGDAYIRTLLIHGARAVLRTCGKKDDRLSKWLQGIVERRGKNRAAVALANKIARIVWALLQRGGEYRVTA